MEMNAVTVEDVLRTEFTTVPERCPSTDGGRWSISSWICFPGRDWKGRMNGIISLNDIPMVALDELLVRRGVVADIMTREMITVFPHGTLIDPSDGAIGRKAIKQMPVVNRKNPREHRGPERMPRRHPARQPELLARET